MAETTKHKALLTADQALTLLENMHSSDSEKEIECTGMEREDNLLTESEFDDSDYDKDWKPGKHDLEVSTDSEQSEENEHPQMAALTTGSEENGCSSMAAQTTGQVKRHKRSAPQTWKRQILKEKRLKGKAYANSQGQVKLEKLMGPECNSRHCVKSNKRSCNQFDEEQRKAVFDKFWSMKSWEMRKLFVQTLVDNVPIKQKKSGPESRRGTSKLYHLPLINDKKLPVCKQLFCSTLGIPLRTIGSWLRGTKKEVEHIPKKKVNKSGPHVPVSSADKAYLLEWLRGLPTVPSHYCRQVPSYKDKKFLEPGTTQSDLYKEYKEAAADKTVRIVSETFFRTVFHEEKYSVFVPRKDQCDICVGAKMGNIKDDTLSTHRALKSQAQAEKASDKSAACDKLSVWTMDLQRVLLCPYTKASTMYYKTKLQVHNFTCFDLETKDGYCYPWEEHEGSLSGEVFAFLQYNHFKAILEAKPGIEKVIVWSDGCGYQNRNTCVANMYLDLAMKFNIIFEQKFLVAGHTQMECDSMHSLIERRIVQDIHTPQDYFTIMKTARLHPHPYRVSQLYHNDFKKLSGAYVTNIRPGKKVGDPTVHALRALQYLPEGKICYKVDFSKDWENLPQRLNISSEPFNWVRLFPDQLPISLRKFNDLQSMKSVIRREAHQYYDNLPHQND